MRRHGRILQDQVRERVRECMDGERAKTLYGVGDVAGR